jgi:hypothetical protein
MTSNTRYPISYTILAGLAGAIAWGLPYPLDPLMQLFRFMPYFPMYESPPFHVPLAKLTFSYAVSGIIAGGLFLLGIRFLPVNRNRYFRPSLSLAIVLSTIAGLAIGGMVAILIGLLIGSSHTGYMLAYRLGFGIGSIEPYLSVGWGLGTALATIIFFSFSGLMEEFASVSDSSIRLTLKTALRVSIITLFIRSITCFIEFSSIVTYTIGNSIIIFILFQLVSGLFFGIITWVSCSKLKPA